MIHRSKLNNHANSIRSTQIIGQFASIGYCDVELHSIHYQLYIYLLWALGTSVIHISEYTVCANK